MKVAAGAAAPQGPRVGALLVAAALFMENLDGTIIANAMPHMAASFGVPAVSLDIGMTAYLVAMGVFIPLSGWVADRFGGRRVFAAAIALFSCASLGCAASAGLASFVVARVVQGVAAAMMTPVGRLLVLRDAPKTELIRTIALLTWPALLAPAIAPPLGGLIVEHASWRWIFLLNLPLGVIGTVLALRLMPATRDDHPGPMDLPGLALWAVAASLLVVTVGGAARMVPATLIVLSGTCGASAVLACRHFRRVRAPLLDPATLAEPSFAHVVIGGSLVRVAILANPFLLPLFLQLGLGLSAIRSGVLILIGMGGNIAMKFATTPILERVSRRGVLIVNGALLAAGFAGFLFVDRSTPWLAIDALLVATGLSRSMQFTTLNTLAFAHVPRAAMAASSTLLSTVMQVNAALGVAVGALSLELSGMLRGGDGAPALADFHVAFVLLALLCLGGAACATRLEKQGPLSYRSI